MILLGLTGFAQAGKDTVSEILCEYWGFERRAFADKLKQVALGLNPIVDAAVTVGEEGYKPTYRRLTDVIQELGYEDAKKHPEVRRTYQRLGTEGGRNVFGESFWIDACLGEPLTERTVVTDVRFANEAAAIRALGGKVARIDRPGVGPINGHVSDAGIDNDFVDQVIDNDGDLDDLQHAVNIMLNTLGWT